MRVVVRVPAVPLPGYPSFRLGLPSRRLRNTLIKHQADVVHLASPVVLGAHGAAVARRLAPSTVTATGLLGRGIANVWLWDRGVDTARFDPARRSAQIRAGLAPGGELIAGYVGRLAPEKHVELLAGITALPGVRLVIVGAGRSWPALTEELIGHYAAVLGGLRDAGGGERGVRAARSDRRGRDQRGGRGPGRRRDHPAVLAGGDPPGRGPGPRRTLRLAAAGYPVGPGPNPEPSTPPPSRMAEVGWMATKGTMWLVRRSRDLVPALVALAVREWLTAEDEVTERELVPVSEHPST